MNVFFKWLDKHPRKNSKLGKHFSELHQIWQAGRQNDFPEADIDNAWLRVDSMVREAAKDRVQVPFIKRQPAFAAIAMAALLLGVLSSVYFFLQPRTNFYQTQAGETLSVLLPDSSKIILNAVSQIDFKEGFGTDHRHLNLDGEALFHVKKDSLPFNIVAGSAAVRVVGTKFNVKSREEIVRVGVQEGIVEFSNNMALSDSVVRLHKGEQSWCAESGLPQAPSKLTAQIFPDWLYKRLSCKQTPFAEICSELERRFNTSIIIKDEQIKSVHISGLFEAQDLEVLLKTICVLIEKEYRYEQGTIIIY